MSLARAETEATLVIEDLSHSYGSFVAARDVDLRVNPGELHCLLGPSGSGKSTILRLVAGLEKLQTGRIFIDGLEIAGAWGQKPPERRSVGFVFQDYALFPHLDVRRNVIFGMDGKDRHGQKAAADELLERVGMADHASAMPHTLSGGQQQRVALARALAREPKVMLLDEPFSGLDARLRSAVRSSTLEILHAAGVATLMVTHDPHEALVTGDVVSVIREGRLVRTGPPADVYGRSGSLKVAEVFGAVNRFFGKVVGDRIETPLGPIPTDGSAPALADGEEAEILWRPESLKLHSRATAEDSRTTAKGTITEVLPGSGILEITVELDDGTRLHVHDLPRHPWQRGEAVWVEPIAGSAMVHGPTGNPSPSG